MDTGTLQDAGHFLGGIYCKGKVPAYPGEWPRPCWHFSGRGPTPGEAKFAILGWGPTDTYDYIKAKNARGPTTRGGPFARGEGTSA